MFQLVSSAVIDRPVNEVWDFIWDMDNFPKWDTGGRSWEWVSGEPMCIGCEARMFGKVGPFEIGGRVRLIELESYRMATWQHLDWGKGRTRFTFERVGEGTRVTKVAEPAPGREAPLWMNLLRPLLQKRYSRYIPNLKRAVEQSAKPATPTAAGSKKVSV